MLQTFARTLQPTISFHLSTFPRGEEDPQQSRANLSEFSFQWILKITQITHILPQYSVPTLTDVSLTPICPQIEQLVQR